MRLVTEEPQRLVRYAEAEPSGTFNIEMQRRAALLLVCEVLMSGCGVVIRTLALKWRARKMRYYPIDARVP